MACSMSMTVSHAKKHTELLSSMGLDTCTSDPELQQIQSLVLRSPQFKIQMSISNTQ